MFLQLDGIKARLEAQEVLQRKSAEDHKASIAELQKIHGDSLLLIDRFMLFLPIIFRVT
jgi:hypothetical protein